MLLYPVEALEGQFEGKAQFRKSNKSNNSRLLRLLGGLRVVLDSHDCHPQGIQIPLL